MVNIPLCIYFDPVFISKLEQSLEAIALFTGDHNKWAKAIKAGEIDARVLLESRPISISSFLPNSGLLNKLVYRNWNDKFNAWLQQKGLFDNESNMLFPVVDPVSSRPFWDLRPGLDTNSYFLSAEAVEFFKQNLLLNLGEVEGKAIFLDATGRIVEEASLLLKEACNCQLSAIGYGRREGTVKLNRWGIEQSDYALLPIIFYKNYKYIVFMEHLFDDADQLRRIHKINLELFVK